MKTFFRRSAFTCSLLLMMSAAAYRFVNAEYEMYPEHVSDTELRVSVSKTTNGLAVHTPFVDPAARTLMVRRDKSGEVELHLTTNDVLIAQEGLARMILGGQIEGGVETGPNEFRGGRIVGGQIQRLEPGDVLWIPAGVPHQIILEAGSSFSYLVVKSNKSY